MNFLEKIGPLLPLRLGLGFMYLYSGFGLLTQPQNWYGFLPQWFLGQVTKFTSLDVYLRFQGVGELILAFLFLAWFLGRRVVRIASVLAVLEFIFILFFVGIDLITFRDIGLLGASLTALLLTFKEE